jgi:8-oxo-dGTP pyrophosphatase MutT (NUDIX family)
MTESERMHAVDPKTARTRVTVAAIVESAGRFLLVEERDAENRLVINQPAGHVEAGESLPEALIRETYEETGWWVEPRALVGAYLWGNAGGTVSYLRIAIAAGVEQQDAKAVLDDGIERPLWLTRAELAAARDRHRSELVLRCVDDYLSGETYSLDALKSLLR